MSATPRKSRADHKPKPISDAKNYEQREASRKEGKKDGKQRVRESKSKIADGVRKQAKLTGLPQTEAVHEMAEWYEKYFALGVGDPIHLARVLAHFIFQYGEIPLCPHRSKSIPLHQFWDKAIQAVTKVKPEFAKPLLGHADCELVFKNFFAGLVCGAGKENLPEPKIGIFDDGKKITTRLVWPDGSLAKVPQDYFGLRPVVIPKGWTFRNRTVSEDSLANVRFRSTKEFEAHVKMILWRPSAGEMQRLRKKKLG